MLCRVNRQRFNWSCGLMLARDKRCSIKRFTIKIQKLFLTVLKRINVSKGTFFLHCVSRLFSKWKTGMAFEISMAPYKYFNEKHQHYFTQKLITQTRIRKIHFLSNAIFWSKAQRRLLFEILKHTLPMQYKPLKYPYILLWYIMRVMLKF